MREPIQEPDLRTVFRSLQGAVPLENTPGHKPRFERRMAGDLRETVFRVDLEAFAAQPDLRDEMLSGLAIPAGGDGKTVKQVVVGNDAELFVSYPARDYREREGVESMLVRALKDFFLTENEDKTALEMRREEAVDRLLGKSFGIRASESIKSPAELLRKIDVPHVELIDNERCTTLRVPTELPEDSEKVGNATRDAQLLGLYPHYEHGLDGNTWFKLIGMKGTSEETNRLSRNMLWMSVAYSAEIAASP